MDPLAIWIDDVRLVVVGRVGSLGLDLGSFLTCNIQVGSEKDPRSNRTLNPYAYLCPTTVTERV